MQRLRGRYGQALLMSPMCRNAAIVVQDHVDSCAEAREVDEPSVVPGLRA